MRGDYINTIHAFSHAKQLEEVLKTLGVELIYPILDRSAYKHEVVISIDPSRVLFLRKQGVAFIA